MNGQRGPMLPTSHCTLHQLRVGLAETTVVKGIVHPKIFILSLNYSPSVVVSNEVALINFSSICTLLE